MITRIETYSRRAVTGWRGRSHEALISIETEGFSAGTLGAQHEGWALAPLVLVFDDIQRAVDPTDWLVTGKPMTREQAESVWRYVALAANHGARTLIVHCDQGISRSTAIANVICAELRIPVAHSQSEVRPNKHVAELMGMAALRTNRGTR